MIVECKLNTLRQLKFFDGRTPALVFESLPSGDDQLLSIVYRYLANDPSFPSFLERKIKSRRIELSLSLSVSALFHLDSPPYFSRHGRMLEKEEEIEFAYLLYVRTRPRIADNKMGKKNGEKGKSEESSIRRSGITSLWNLASRTEASLSFHCDDYHVSPFFDHSPLFP